MWLIGCVILFALFHPNADEVLDHIDEFPEYLEDWFNGDF